MSKTNRKDGLFLEVISEGLDNVSRSGNLEKVKAVIEDSNISITKDILISALFESIYKDKVEVFKFLFSKINDTECRANKRWYKGYTPLIVAAYEGATDCVEFLIEKGANLQANADSPYSFENMSQLIPLHAAIKKCNLRIASSLIEAGLDINCVNNKNETALFEVARMTGEHNALRALRFLTKRNINPLIKNNEDETAYGISASCPFNTHTVKNMLRNYELKYREHV